MINLNANSLEYEINVLSNFQIFGYEEMYLKDNNRSISVTCLSEKGELLFTNKEFFEENKELSLFSDLINQESLSFINLVESRLKSMLNCSKFFSSSFVLENHCLDMRKKLLQMKESEIKRHVFNCKNILPEKFHIRRMNSKLEKGGDNFCLADSWKTRYGRFNLNSYKQYNSLSSRIINNKQNTTNQTHQEEKSISKISKISSLDLSISTKNIYDSNYKKKINKNEDNKSDSSNLPSIISPSKFAYPKIMRVNMNMLKNLTKRHEKATTLSFDLKDKDSPISPLKMSPKFINSHKSDVKKSSPIVRSKEVYTSMENAFLEKI